MTTIGEAIERASEALEHASAKMEALEALCRALVERLDRPCKAVLSVPERMGPEEAAAAGALVSQWLEAPRAGAAITIPADCELQLYNALGVSLSVEVRREEAPVSVEVVEIAKPVTASITYKGAA